MRQLMTKVLAGVLLMAGMTLAGAAMAANAYDFSFDKIEGGPLPLSQYKGKAVLVVNTASFCGFTPQYTGLEKLWKKYRAKGLVIIGVPANNFGGQEPGSNQDIQHFCTAKYDVDFPMTGKVSVKGDDMHPFYQWASATLGPDNAPKWNFHKYLISPTGELVAAFPSKVEPQSEELAAAIEGALPKK